MQATEVNVTDSGIDLRLEGGRFVLPEAPQGQQQQQQEAAAASCRNRRETLESCRQLCSPSSTARLPDSPRRVAPASIIATASSAVRMPPLA